MGVDSPTAANADTFRTHAHDLIALEQAFPLEPGQCGAVLALGGTLCLDWVSRPEAFAQLWPKLRRGYLLDALEALDGTPRPPGARGRVRGRDGPRARVPPGLGRARRGRAPARARRDRVRARARRRAAAALRLHERRRRRPRLRPHREAEQEALTGGGGGREAQGETGARPPRPPHTGQRRRGQRWMRTGVPGTTVRASHSTSAFATRTQPCDLAVPSGSARLAPPRPWIATRPGPPP